MKCSACKRNECNGEYANHSKCKGTEEGINCSCFCKETTGEVVASTALSMCTGASVFVGKTNLKI